MTDEGASSNPRRLSQIFDPLSRLSELTRESRSTPSSPRLLPRRPRESSSGVLPPSPYDVSDHGSDPFLGVNGINWQERCFELQRELQRSRAQATRTRDMLREKVYKPSLWYFEKLSFLNAYLNIRWANSNYEDVPTVTEPPAQTYPYDRLANDDPLFVEVDVRDVKQEKMSPIVRDETPDAFYPSPEISSRSTTPPTCKRGKFEAADSYRTQDEEQDGLYDTAKALSALTAAASTSSLNKDEDEIFSEYICSRLKNITNRRKKLILRNKIEQLIFEVELEENA